MFSNALISIKPHPSNSIRYGIFARRAIPMDTLLLIETQLVRARPCEFSKEIAYASLPSEKKVLFNKLHASCSCSGQYPSRTCAKSQVMKTWDMNAFCDGRDSAMFYIASHFNHACMPNAGTRHKEGVIKVFAMRDIQEGEEITVTYVDPILPMEIRRELLRHWGFTCHCEACETRKILRDGDREHVKLDEEHLEEGVKNLESEDITRMENLEEAMINFQEGVYAFQSHLMVKCIELLRDYTNDTLVRKAALVAVMQKVGELMRERLPPSCMHVCQKSLGRIADVNLYVMECVSDSLSAIMMYFLNVQDILFAMCLC